MSAAAMSTRWADPLEAWTPGTPAGPNLRAAWSVRRALPVRIVGTDIVRITSSTWTETARVLAERGVAIGPFLVAIPRACVEVVVAAGTATAWPPLPSTVCVSGAIVRCPAPAVYAASGRPPVSGRLWVVPPILGRPEDVTDADALAEAVGAALLRCAHTLRARLNAHSREAQS